MPPASSLRTTAELTAALGALQSAEADVTASLATLLASSNPINAALLRLNGLTPKLEEIEKDASVLHGNVERTAQTADRVGSRVKALDEEMRRVREASERVAMVMELKASISTLSLHSLTIYSHHYLSYIPPSTLKSGKPLLDIALAQWQSQNM